ncbi:Mom family adenine methylcarbamoylation protein [Streptomyces ambofaciens]
MKVQFGLYDTADGGRRLNGVAVFGVPVNTAVLAKPLPELRPFTESVECSRFVLLDECPGNTESWFLARCFDLLLTRGVRGVVSFADPVPRRTASGLLVMPGHVGTIYAATNALYTGRATARTVKLLPDGTVFHDRTAQKIRRQEQGCEYATAQLLALGAPRPRPAATGRGGCARPWRRLAPATSAIAVPTAGSSGSAVPGASGTTSGSASPPSGPTPSAPTPSTRRPERAPRHRRPPVRPTTQFPRPLESCHGFTFRYAHHTRPGLVRFPRTSAVRRQGQRGHDGRFHERRPSCGRRRPGDLPYHSSLGVLEWPPVVFDGVRYPGVSELAALQSAAFGFPPPGTPRSPARYRARTAHGYRTVCSPRSRPTAGSPARAARTAARQPRRAWSPAPGRRWSAS